jgi:gluconokinase
VTTLPKHLVVIGVSGSGKSLIGIQLAAWLGYEFIDADDLHTDANKTKMISGIPLTDEDRWPWLKTCGEALATTDSAVLACSALKREYRQHILKDCPDALFIHLLVDQQELKRRMESRSDHFMPPSLLSSQLESMEELQVVEPGFTISAVGEVVEIVGSIARQLAGER